MKSMTRASQRIMGKIKKEKKYLGQRKTPFDERENEKEEKLMQRLAAHVGEEDKEDKDKEESKGGDETALSRGQRKRRLRTDRLKKKKELVSKIADSTLKLAVKSGGNSKFGQLFALGDLGGALPELNAALDAQERGGGGAGSEVAEKLTVKKKQKLCVEESDRLQKVMEIPQFVDNPMATIYEHLENTIKMSQPKKQHKEEIRERRREEHAADYETAMKKRAAEMKRGLKNRKNKFSMSKGVAGGKIEKGKKNNNNSNGNKGGQNKNKNNNNSNNNNKKPQQQGKKKFGGGGGGGGGRRGK